MPYLLDSDVLVASNRIHDHPADAWLIAYAASDDGWTIVTNEVAAPASKRDIKLPDAAQAQGIRTIPLHVLLRRHAMVNFAFKK